MSSPEDLQKRMEELGQRYLERTDVEVGQLGALIARIADGGNSIYQEIEVIVHRIRGSGAMFGYNALSEAASAMEILSAEAKDGEHPDRTATQSRLADMHRTLALAVREARTR